ncbi:MAG: hypothetical protein M2R46_04659 [Verrucomicrobia subdivision 3 bacterium]|nr:hypothetical protein [Limisphaerales bacterium]
MADDRASFAASPPARPFPPAKARKTNKRLPSLHRNSSESLFQHPILYLANHNRRLTAKLHAATTLFCARLKGRFSFTETARTLSCLTAGAKAKMDRLLNRWKLPCAASAASTTTLAKNGAVSSGRLSATRANLNSAWTTTVP